MYYAAFGALSLILHLIINYDILKKKDKTASLSTVRYRQFLICISVYYISDVLWGFFEESRIIPLVYADTVLYFLTMAMSVVLWIRYVIAFIDREGTRSTALAYAGSGIFAFSVLSVVINFFYPVIFSFDAVNGYVPSRARYIIFVALFLLNLILSAYSAVVSMKVEGKDRVHYLIVSASGTVSAIFIVFQTLYPLLPFYAIGLLVSTSLIHVFVEEDEKLEVDRKLRTIEKQAESEQIRVKEAEKEREIYNHIANSLAEDYEAIYYINIETGRYREFSPSDEYLSMNVPKFCEDFYLETMDNVLMYVHPDDRNFALGLYDKEIMLKNLEGKNSYSYKYRVMVNGEPRYFRFVVMLADDGKHFVLCEKDINDEITSENMRKNYQNNHVTFGQIAESLASNYDVIYYVNISDTSYVSYTTRSIFGNLEMSREGEDFFADAGKNISLLIHPSDADRILDILNMDYLITTLENRKQFDVRYRIIVDNDVRYTRLSVRKTSDSGHLIIGVENIDDEVRKEKEHLIALNTEKELARRDELTGIKNKTAYSELEQSVQSNIENGMDYLPFALAICDINDLKKVNDTEGHKAGDEYIKAAASILCDIFGHSPVFRIGGDEFVVFLRGDDYNAREELILRLKNEVLTSIMSGDRKRPTIAVGMSKYRPGEDTSVSEIFERADNRMYENKRALKGQKKGAP
ncbi:MAG: diguanylate cyclase [Lachnospiraceae bacterium]|nr:diguanylate cyclase [Lachnospiraceae bacterium]